MHGPGLFHHREERNDFLIRYSAPALRTFLGADRVWLYHVLYGVPRTP